MPHERQRAIAQELDARFPKDKGNIGQQTFRSAYVIGRMAGLSQGQAHEQALASVRQSQPDFTPIEHPSLPRA